MKTLFLIMGLISIGSLNAQISATTSSGKRVLLNTDGTWKYADGTSTEGEKECQKTLTCSITFKNSALSDVYVYLNDTRYSYYTVNKTRMVKVKSGTSKTISDVESGATDYAPNRTATYNWKALLEMANANSNFSDISGIASGSVTTTTCAEKQIEIED